MIDSMYAHLCKTPSDINEHLPTLKKYAEKSERIVELGVRGMVSTWALLAGRPRWMRSYDIVHPLAHGGDVLATLDAANQEGIDWDFVLRSSLEVDLPEHEFLFVDTLHTYDQLKAELERHQGKVTKFIAMHDTNMNEMAQAVNEFLDKHQEWEVAEYFANNNGCTFLKRI